MATGPLVSSQPGVTSLIPINNYPASFEIQVECAAFSGFFTPIDLQYQRGRRCSATTTVKGSHNIFHLRLWNKKPCCAA